MRAAAHLRLACLGALVWVAFWVGGLPDYYQQYSFAAMLAFSIALVPVIALIAWATIRRTTLSRRRELGFWLSFYFTVPLMLFDYIYCGLYLAHGWHFFAEYWYLTAFYIIPWLVLVPIAHVLSRQRLT
ncbi:MAG: hypothetical protein BWK76_23365 [Desulfobulbaceae bacterium A2]|nr:MAG: hypothetical protein BWK76_23365 [Desulfobulbaceae bacterium A2]